MKMGSETRKQPPLCQYQIVTWRWAAKQGNNPHCVNIRSLHEDGQWNKETTPIVSISDRYMKMGSETRKQPPLCQYQIVTWRWAVKQGNNPHCVNIRSLHEDGQWNKETTPIVSISDRYMKMGSETRKQPPLCQYQIVTWRWAVKQGNNPHCVNIRSLHEDGQWNKETTPIVSISDRYMKMGSETRKQPPLCQYQIVTWRWAAKQGNNPHCVNIRSLHEDGQRNKETTPIVSISDRYMKMGSETRKQPPLCQYQIVTWRWAAKQGNNPHCVNIRSLHEDGQRNKETTPIVSISDRYMKMGSETRKQPPLCQYQIVTWRWAAKQGNNPHCVNIRSLHEDGQWNKETTPIVSISDRYMKMGSEARKQPPLCQYQ